MAMVDAAVVNVVNCRSVCCACAIRAPVRSHITAFMYGLLLCLLPTVSAQSEQHCVPGSSCARNSCCGNPFPYLVNDNACDDTSCKGKNPCGSGQETYNWRCERNVPFSFGDGKCQFSCRPVPAVPYTCKRSLGTCCAKSDKDCHADSGGSFNFHNQSDCAAACPATTAAPTPEPPPACWTTGTPRSA